MSGSQVAYHLRVNKHIDRQMFLEAIRLVNRSVPIHGHGYVSMAGAYLEDCRILHQSTEISRMYSFDSSEQVLQRQAINRPYGFVLMEMKSSGEVVLDFDSVRSTLVGAEANVIVWLDYAAAKERRSQLQELSTLVTKLLPGDIVRFTMNANRSTLGENSEYVRLLSGRPATLAAWRLTRLKEALGEYLPADRNGEEFLESKDGFYKTMIRAVKHAVLGSLQTRPELYPFPVLSTAYDDSHGMITVTFVIIPTSGFAEFESDVAWEQEWQHKPGPHWDQYTEIQVPHLSIQERHLLHSMIQKGCIFDDNPPGFVTSTEFDQYRLHYRRYPTFAPLDIV